MLQAQLHLMFQRLQMGPHLCLYHQRPVHPKIIDNTIHIHGVLILYLIDQTIDSNECARPSDPSTRKQRHESSLPVAFTMDLSVLPPVPTSPLSLFEANTNFVAQLHLQASWGTHLS